MEAGLTLQWMTTTCWGSLFSQDSWALQMVHTLSRGGACSSGQPTSRICNEREGASWYHLWRASEAFSRWLFSFTKIFHSRVKKDTACSFSKTSWELRPGSFTGKKTMKDYVAPLRLLSLGLICSSAAGMTIPEGLSGAANGARLPGRGQGLARSITLPAQSDSSFLPNQSLCTQSLCPHSLLVRLQSVRSRRPGQRPRRRRDGVIRPADREQHGPFSCLHIRTLMEVFVFCFWFFNRNVSDFLTVRAINDVFPRLLL